jgi:RNA polymerase sigma-70 factor (ECF subfamily)
MNPTAAIVPNKVTLLNARNEPIMPASAQFAEIIGENFQDGRSHYGEIDLSPNCFVEYVWGIACKHVRDCAEDVVIADFAKKLYLRDLYLTCGCVNRIERAWEAFDHRYRRFVTDLVRFCYRHGTDNEEVADSVLVSLCLPDRSGRQRIASYDGRSSLATWLRVIVINRAINDRNEKKIANDDSVVDVPDSRAVVNMECAVRAGRYSKALSESLSCAFQTLTARERLMLLWRYEENLQLGEIAKLLGIHQSNVTRQLVRLQARLRDTVIRCLTSEHHLGPSAVQECLADITENPHLSISLGPLARSAPTLVPGNSAA